MIFTSTKQELLGCVNTAVRAIPAHSTMDILLCILIRAEGQVLTFTANDMEMGIETKLSASVAEPGTIAVDAKMFSEIIRKLPDETVRIEATDGGQVFITCAKAKFEIGGRSGEDFVELPNPEREECVSISQFTLKNLISQTIFCIAQNESNRMMNGELFEISGDILRVVALDGHRIAIRKTGLKKSYSPRKAVIPGKTLQEMARILQNDTDKDVDLYFSESYVVMETEGTRMVSRLIDGEYFSVDTMITSDFETKVTVSRSQLLSCVDRASLFVREGDKKPIIFEIGDHEMHLSIESQLGSMDDAFEIEKEGRDLVIGFNPKFMMDALKAVDEENVTIYLINPKAPCFIRDENDSYLYLVLPVNFIR